MSRSPPLYDDDDDPDLPPPYTPSPSTLSATPTPTSATPTPSLVLLTPLTAHLANLPSRLHSVAAHHRASRDTDAAARAVPHVADLLARLDAAAASRTHTVPALAELVLVPAAAVSRGWALTGAAERRREGEVVRVARVEGEERKGKGEKEKAGKGGGKGGGDGYAAADQDNHARGSSDDSDGYVDGGRPGDAIAEFDDWGRWDDGPAAGGGTGAAAGDLLWWNDEDMARRVAAHLRPAEHVVVERRQVHAVVERAKEESKGWLWRRKSAKTTPTTTAAPRATVAAGPRARAAVPDDSATMTVQAQEVTFRKENEFGVWESLNGFGVVVTVNIRRA